MNKLFLCLLFFFTALTASSQKVYFVYIQTESEQPFFVKLNEKITSSTASGYLILSKLHDSSYNFNIGFPQNKYAEQNFSVSIGQKDHGYLLKNFGEKGWGLFDLQTLTVQMSTSKNLNNNAGAKMDNKEISVFTDILSKAADDPSLKDKPVVKMEEKKTEVAVVEVAKKEESKTVAATVVKTPDTKIVVNEPVVTKQDETTAQPIIKKEEQKAEIKAIVSEPVITKPTEVVTAPVVNKDELKETIILKPLEKVETTEVKNDNPKVEVKETIVTKPIETVAQPVVKVEINTNETEEYKKTLVTKKSESSTTEGFGLVFLDDYQNGTTDTIRLIIPNPKSAVVALKEEPKEEKKFLEIATEPTKKVALKNNCSSIADGSDFQKLRKNMAAEKTDDGMINEATKFFKSKCFTVHQLENLQTLFLDDAGKYKFFDAAYNYASDVENFSSLQSQLKDEYYITRFKAMLRN